MLIQAIKYSAKYNYVVNRFWKVPCLFAGKYKDRIVTGTTVGEVIEKLYDQ